MEIFEAERLISTAGRYPTPFSNWENFNFVSCPGMTLDEFPILHDGTRYAGGQPGAYRVIFHEESSGNGRFCGMLVHPVSEQEILIFSSSQRRSRCGLLTGHRLGLHYEQLCPMPLGPSWLRIVRIYLGGDYGVCDS